MKTPTPAQAEAPARRRIPLRVESIPSGYRPWIVASIAVLVVSLMLLAGTVGASFFYFEDRGSPLWVVILGGVAVFGVLLGFSGFFVMMMIAGWRSFQESRRVQVLSPQPVAAPEPAAAQESAGAVPTPSVEHMAIEYLLRLCRSGYFSHEHDDNAGAWFADLPACRDNDTHQKVSGWLRNNGYLQLEWLSDAEIKARNMHPKDTLDAWWFTLTDKGAAACRAGRF